MMSLPPDNPQECLARAEYARRKAAEAASDEDRRRWLQIAADWEQIAEDLPCELRPSADRIKAEIPNLEKLATRCGGDISAEVRHVSNEMRTIANGLMDLQSKAHRKRTKRAVGE